MHDFMKTIISAIKSWASNEIKNTSKTNVADWNQNDIKASNYIKNRPFYECNGIIHKLDSKFLPDNIGMQADWNETDENLNSFILNKPNLNELILQPDWNETNETSKSFILNKPNIDTKINEAVNVKMDKENPTGSGKISIGTNNYSIGLNSQTFGYGTKNYSENSIVTGKYNIAEQGYIVSSRNNSVSFGDWGILETYREKFLYSEQYKINHKDATFSLIDPIEIDADSLTYLLSQKYYTYFFTANGEATAKNIYTSNNLTMIGPSDRGGRFARNLVEYDLIRSDSSFNGSYVNVIGNGANDNNRSNAHTLDWEGNAWFAGDVYVGSTSGKNKDEGSKKLVTEDELKTLLEEYTKPIAINLDDWGITDICLNLFMQNGGSASTENLSMEEFFKLIPLHTNFECHATFDENCIVYFSVMNLNVSPEKEVFYITLQGYTGSQKIIVGIGKEYINVVFENL